MLSSKSVLRPLVLLSSVVLTACGEPGPQWNVLLLTLDTTRADHLGCYGHPRAATPHLDQLAEDGVLFRRAYSSLPLTLPSHSTILTGVYPPAHGVRDNGLFVLPEEQTTLAERLAAAGYSTAAAIGGFPLESRFGIGQGFDYYDDHLTARWEDFRGDRIRPKPHIYFDERPAGQVNEAIFPWLTENADQPFFAWVHYYDVHQPHQPPKPYDQLFADDPYLGELAYADESFGNLLAHIEGLGQLEKTLIIVTADHGEGRGQHRELTHAYLLYDTTLHVPLIVRLPEDHPLNHGPRQVDTRVSSVDIVPTVLDLLQLDTPDGLQGNSMTRLLTGGESKDRLHYAETLSPRFNNDWGELRALYDGPWKYIHGPRPELYDETADDGEVINLVEKESEVAAAMQEKLATFLSRTAASTSAAATPDEETRRRLEALGYLQGGSSTEVVEELRSDGIAPQDRIDDVTALSLLRQSLFNNQALTAIEIANQLLEGDPTNHYYLEMLAQAQAQLDQVDDLLITLDKLVASGATSGTTESLLHYAGRILYFKGRKEEGLRRVSQSLESLPTADGHYTAAILWHAEGEKEASLEALRLALELEPTHAAARDDLAARLAESGERTAAAAEFNRLLTDHPYHPKAHYNYGVFLAQGGDLDGAGRSLRRAVELDPRYVDPYFALVLVELNAGHREAAEKAHAALAEVAPDHPMTRETLHMLESSL